MPAPPTKLEFEDFLKTCTPLLRIADLEDEMRKRVEDIVQSLLGFQHSSNEDPVQKLKQFLRRDADFLGVLLALTRANQPSNKHLAKLTPDLSVQKLTCVHRAHIGSPGGE